MRLPWSKPKADQLELLDADPELPHESSVLPSEAVRAITGAAALIEDCG